MIEPWVLRQRERAVKIIAILKKNTKSFVKPMVSSIIDQYGNDPFLVLVSCLLSLRAKDTVTLPVCQNLFSHAKTPQQILAIPLKDLEKILYKLGFYRKKALGLKIVSEELLEHFGGKVPRTREELLSLPGVGPKTASLVLAESYGIPAICVDTHVHRISNRLGLVKTKTPEQTEKALEKILPKEYWSEWNRLLVMWGQNVCLPVVPACSRCAIYDECQRVGVKKRA
ncbi:MAG: endonuclease III [Candidatus Babeliales bacterium]